MVLFNVVVVVRMWVALKMSEQVNSIANTLHNVATNYLMENTEIEVD